MAAGTQTTAQIAVIVPVYNPGDYLHQCVDSILQQTYTDWELILVDDGSTDGSGAVCDAYAAQDARVRVLHKENGGLMSAWISGVARSSAPYLFFVDSDDWVDTDSLERLYAALTSTDSASDLACKARHPLESVSGLRQIVCAGCMIEREWNHTSVPEDNAAAPGVYEGERLQTQIKNQLLGNEYRRILPSRCMKLIDRRLIEENLHYCDPSIKMGEDLNIMAPAMLDADRIVLLDKVYLYHYRFVSESMVHKYDAGLYENVKRLTDILRQALHDKKVPDADGMADREFVYLFLLTLKNEIRRNAKDAEICHRIQELCKQEHSSQLLSTIGGAGTLTSGANKLLASMMDKPTALRIRIVRKVFQLKG